MIDKSSRVTSGLPSCRAWRVECESALKATTSSGDGTCAAASSAREHSKNSSTASLRFAGRSSRRARPLPELIDQTGS